MPRTTLIVALAACVREADPPTRPPGATSTTPPASTYAWKPGALVLRAVTVVDGDGRRGPVTVVLVGDRIDAVLDGVPAVPADATVVADGGFVTPGLVDPHVHLFLTGSPWFVGDALPANLRATVLHGVTTAVDVGGPASSFGLRDRIAAGSILGPSLLALGPMVTAPGSHPCELVRDPVYCRFVQDAAEGQAAGAERAAAGADGVKVAIADASFTPWPTPRLDGDALGAVVAAAGGLSFAHVDEADDLLAALDAGVDVLAHPVFGGAASPSLLARVAAEARATTSTIGAFSGTLELLDGTLPLDVAGLDPDTAAAWAWVRDHPASVDPDWIAGSIAWTADAEASIVGLDAAGAVVLPGSDAGYLYVPHGRGLHLELARLQALGFDPGRLIGLATGDAARSLGLDDRGEVRTDLRADLLVVDVDPLADLATLRSPALVILAGVVHDPADLADVDVLLSAARADLGDFCLDARDCGSGACDRYAHACVEPCGRVGAPDSACGPDAWCAPDDVTAGDPVCRVVTTCDPLAPDPCGGPYDERCVRLDLDTATCLPANP